MLCYLIFIKMNKYLWFSKSWARINNHEQFLKFFQNLSIHKWLQFKNYPDLFLHLHNFKLLLRKIALPYPHKCLLGFVEAKRGDQQEYLKIILVREVNPVVSDRCACAQHIVGWTLSRDPHSIFGRRGGCAFFFGRSSWRSHS